VNHQYSDLRARPEDTAYLVRHVRTDSLNDMTLPSDALDERPARVGPGI